MIVETTRRSLAIVAGGLLAAMAVIWLGVWFYGAPPASPPPAAQGASR